MDRISNRLLLYGVILFIFGIITTDGFLPINMQHINNIMLLKWLLRATIRDIGLIIIISTVIITNIQLLIIGGKNTKLVKLVVAYSICIVFIAMNYAYYTKFNTIYNNTIKDNSTDKLSNQLNNSISASRKAKYEELLAQQYYVMHNRLVTINDVNGNKTIYKPTPEINKLKKIYEEAAYMINWIIIRTIYSSIIWLLVPILSSLYGLKRIRDCHKSRKINGIAI